MLVQYLKNDQIILKCMTQYIVILLIRQSLKVLHQLFYLQSVLFWLVIVCSIENNFYMKEIDIYMEQWHLCSIMRLIFLCNMCGNLACVFYIFLRRSKIDFWRCKNRPLFYHIMQRFTDVCMKQIPFFLLSLFY